MAAELKVGGLYEFFGVEMVYHNQELSFRDGDKFLVKSFDNYSSLRIVTIILVNGLEQELYACIREIME
jgi:hypothetical protein